MQYLVGRPPLVSSRDFPHAPRFQSENYGGFGHVIGSSLWLIGGRWDGRHDTVHFVLLMSCITRLCKSMGTKASALPATYEKEGLKKFEQQSIFNIFNHFFLFWLLHKTARSFFFLISWVSETESLLMKSTQQPVQPFRLFSARQAASVRPSRLPFIFYLFIFAIVPQYYSQEMEGFIVYRAELSIISKNWFLVPSKYLRGLVDRSRRAIKISKLFLPLWYLIFFSFPGILAGSAIFSRVGNNWLNGVFGWRLILKKNSSLGNYVIRLTDSLLG